MHAQSSSQCPLSGRFLGLPLPERLLPAGFSASPTGFLLLVACCGFVYSPK